MSCQDLSDRIEAIVKIDSVKERISELEKLLVGRCFKSVQSDQVSTIKILRVSTGRWGDDVEIVSYSCVLEHDDRGGSASMNSDFDDTPRSMSEFLEVAVEIDDSEFKRIKAVVKFVNNRIVKDIEKLQ